MNRENISISNILNNIINNGFYCFTQSISSKIAVCELARSFASDTKYTKGGCAKGKHTDFPTELSNLVVTKPFNSLFESFGANPQDIFITHEYNSSTKERNNYLHFDRSRCLKVMVYLEEVTARSGPLTVAPGSHRIGRYLRVRENQKTNYADKLNRIDIDYPGILYEEWPILGPAGTTILFDTDIFHKGGNVVEGETRTVIRSHYYGDQKWQENK